MLGAVQTSRTYSGHCKVGPMAIPAFLGRGTEAQRPRAQQGPGWVVTGPWSGKACTAPLPQR